MNLLDELARRLATATTDLGPLLTAAATAEAAYKTERAKAVLRARVDAKSMSEAETVADADDRVSELLMARLTTAALADSQKELIRSLRAHMDAEQTNRADQRAADMAHARGLGGHS